MTDLSANQAGIFKVYNSEDMTLFHQQETMKRAPITEGKFSFPVVHSLHKSAPGLAQTAVLWQRTTRISATALRCSLQRLQSSSPSAVVSLNVMSQLVRVVFIGRPPWSVRRGVARHAADDLVLRVHR